MGIDIDRAEIQHKIEQLKAQRDQFITQANLQLANANGQIQALEDLIKPKEPPEEPAE